MRRGGTGKERSDQPHNREVTISTTRVLHLVPRVCIGVALTGGGIASMFMWDWRFIGAGLMVTLGGLIVGPWVDPHEKARVGHKQVPLQHGDDEVHL